MLLGLILGLILGVVLTVVARQFISGGDTQRIKELEDEREKYRQKVDGHFVKTSVLLKDLADQYRDVYKHMAEGAGELCSDEAKASQLDLADLTLLGQTNTNEQLTSQGIEGEPMDVMHDEQGVQERADTEQQIDDYELPDEEEMPLAGEVEISPEMAQELKKQSAEKSKENKT